MFGIGEIKVNADGKTPEQVKAEIMEQVAKQVDSMVGLGNKAHKKQPKPAKIIMSIQEDKKRTGYGVETDIEVEDLAYENIMTMLTDGVGQIFKQLFEEDKLSGVIAISQFQAALVDNYMTEDDEEEEEENNG